MRGGAVGAVICVCLVAIGATYSVALNRLYYRDFGPFFDSLSFNNQLADVQAVARSSGFTAAIKSTAGSTVALPWIAAAMLALVTHSSRTFGVYFQAALLLATLLSVLTYLQRVARWRLIDALLAATALLTMSCLYRTDGGLSDFRMDLGMCLLFLCTITWVWIAKVQNGIAVWAIAGTFAAATCLDRATAPVYLAVALVPVLVLQGVATFRGDRKAARTFSLGVLLFVSTTFVLAGWMYVTRWQQLRWYYLIWNRHAQTHLPVVPTFIWHLRHAVDNLGPASLLLLIFFALFGPSGLTRRRTTSIGQTNSIRWGVIYVALAPLLLLALQGAGHNPFVSMPAAAGLCLFCFAPRQPSALQHGFAIGRRPISTTAVLLIVSAVTLFSAANGIADHLRPQSGSNLMAGQQAVIRVLLADCDRTRVNTFSTAEFGCVNNRSMLNVLMFDDGFQPTPAGVARGNICLSADGRFEPTEPVEWAAMPGCTDAEKIEAIGNLAARDLDYVILGDELTASHLQQKGFISQINQHAIAVRASILLHGTWRPVGRPVVVSADEVLIIYRNTARR